MIYLKLFRFPVNRLWFISPSKIDLLSLDQKANILWKLLAHSSSYTLFVRRDLYSGTNKLLGIVGLGRLGMIGIGLVHALALIHSICYSISHWNSGKSGCYNRIASNRKTACKRSDTLYCVPNIRGCYRYRCSIFNVWKRYGC